MTARGPTDAAGPKSAAANRAAGPQRGRAVLPNAILGGAQKSGTTTLHRLLETHPQIYFPPRPQEIHYFDLERNFARGLGWYARFFAGWSGEAVVAQTSPLYLYEPLAAARIAAALPAARLLFVLRNPIDRAYSHYWHEVRYGYEASSFEEALAAEPERLRGGETARRHYSYLDRGRYGRQLARYFAALPREQILVALYDDLARDPAAIARRVASFLGVSEGWDLPAAAAAERHNPAMVPRWPLAQRALRPFRGVPGLARLVDGLNLRQARYPAMAPATRARLCEELAGEAEELARLANLAVAHWFAPPEERAAASVAGEEQAPGRAYL